LVHREYELTMRSALGASNGRLFRQLVTEAAILSAAGTSVGVWLAFESINLLRQLLTHLTPRAESVAIDPSALRFALTITVIASLATAAVVGCAMPWRRPFVNGRQFSAGVPQARIRAWLLSAQVAFSLVLLAGAGMMIRSFVNLRRVDVGVTRESVVT